MNAEGKSAPVARLHGDRRGLREFSRQNSVENRLAGVSANGSIAADKSKVAYNDADDGSIPPLLRRCEQCGAPSDPIKGAVMPRDFGGVWHWLHERCDFEF
jgi:hypothetical protein